jgi:hypothetical protein
MPVLYYKEDYATLEINLEGDYVLRVVGVGADHADFAVVLEDEELDRYREWGEHFVVTMAHRIHRDPEKYADRNRLAAPVVRELPPPPKPHPENRFPLWAVCTAAAAGALLAYLLMVLVVVGQNGGSWELVGGRAIGLHSAPDDVGDIYYLTVRLDNGKTVQVRVPGKADFKENGALILRESTPSFLGRSRYRFERYR